MAFPLADPQRRRDIVIGGLLFAFVPVVGWILNLGHRWSVMTRLYENDPPWFRGFFPLGQTFGRGLAVAGMGLAYLTPSLVAAGATYLLVGGGAGIVLAAPFIALAGACFYAFPVGINSFVLEGDRSWVWNTPRAFRRAVALGGPYMRMWAITAACIAASLLCTLAFGIGFFIASAWAWSALGFAFGSVINPVIVERERAQG